MTDRHQTTSLATTTPERQADDAATAPSGRDLVIVAIAELRHALEDTRASLRARDRARLTLRTVFENAGAPPHAADRLIAELGPSAREITFAKENPSVLATLATDRAHAVAMMSEANVTTVRGRIGVVLGARLVALGEAAMQGDAKSAAYIIQNGLAAIDRAVEADARIRAEQRDEAARRDWDQRSTQAITIDAEPMQSVDVDVDVSELSTPTTDEDMVERAAATVQRLQAKKASVLGAAAFADARDDEIKIRPTSKPSPTTAKALAKAARSARGTSPLTDGRDHIRSKMTPAQLAERGLFSDSTFDVNPFAVAEAEQQQRERAQRESEFEGGIGRLSGRIGQWKPKPRPMEQAPWQQLAQLRASNADDGDGDDDTNEEEQEPES